MAPVDSLLRLFVDHGADELVLGAGTPPKMFQRGAQMKLALPLTPEPMLRHLLGALLTDEREERLRGGGTSDFDYTPDGGAPSFHVLLRPGSTGLEATFRVGAIGTTATTTTRGTPPPASSGAVPSPAATAPPRSAAPAPVDATPSAAVGPRAPLSARVAAGGPLGAFLAAAFAARASDLHLADGSLPVLRVDGALRSLGRVPVDSIEALLDDLDAAAVRAATSGERALDGTLDFEDRRVRFHVYRAASGPAAALRLLPGLAPALAALQLPVDLGDLALAPSGLIIVCGPTGSGKSATLAALAQEAVRRRAALLVTLEDPIEYRVEPGEHGLCRQRQIGRDVRDFPTGLRDALREDPDILLVGEIRDPESAALALTAAETGHLVLTSLHSRSAASAVERIVDAMPARRDAEVRAQLAQSLRAVVSQRLLPRARGGGRVAAVEVLRVNHNVAALVRDGRTTQLASALQSSRKEGMITLEASLADLVRAGAVTRDSAAAVANDPTALAGYLEPRP